MQSAAPSSNACVVAAGDFPRFDRLIERLGFDRRADPEDGRFCLLETDAGLELRPPEELDRRGIAAAFPPDQYRAASAPRSALVRAFGKRIETILDLTAGLGSDAYRLADAGFCVRAWERHPAIFALVSSAWTRFLETTAAEAETAKSNASGLDRRFVISWGEAADGLREATGPNVAVYLDPMYPPPRRASALPKRNLQVLRLLLAAESQDDQREMVELAERACDSLSRVVVKRPHHAPPLLPAPSHSIESKLVRFDVYTNPERMETDAW